MPTKTYFTQRDADNNKKLNKILYEDLPEFCREYFIGIESKTTTLTRLNYAYDIRLFFQYLITEDTPFIGRLVKDIKLDEMPTLCSFDIEKYVSWLTYYTDKDGNSFSNSAKGKARKLSAIRAMFKYFMQKEKLDKDPTIAVAMPKIKEKEIIRLDTDEIAEMLTVTETGEGLSNRQLSYHENTRVRDSAIVSLLMGTGIRVSELVGIDLSDINFKNSSFVVTRKGGNRVALYFSEEVGGYLYEYYTQRTHDINIPPTEQAFFTSLQNRRITTRAVENIIKKYSSIAAPQKKISPHKLRSTYGTQLYRQTGDIYIVADVLGHKDVNTTKKHYAAISDDIRRKASREVVLRDKIDTDETE